MAALASASDLASWLQKDLDTATATLALNVASGEIRNYCGWSVSQEAGVVATLTGSGTDLLWLPTLRLTAVTSLTENGLARTTPSDFTFEAWGKLRRRRAAWLCEPPQAVVVTFTHGYATVPDDVKGACLSLAARVYDNPGGLRSYTVGGVSETYAGAAADLGPMLAEAELRSLTAYKLPFVG